MTIFLQILFWGSWAALLHTYVLYPFLMRLLARSIALPQIFHAPDSPDLPQVSVIMSVFNEEAVIEEKIESLLSSSYPPEKLNIFIGSDASDDATNIICQKYANSLANFHFFPFTERRGKPAVVNDLAVAAEKIIPISAQHLFLLTDASVMLHPDTIYKLARHFRDEKIGVTDAHIQTYGLKTEGISRSENQYLSGEILLKHYESRAWGKMIGPFGGCYAIRSDLFTPVPQHHLVDDFYITFKVLEKGFHAINDLAATCTEGAVHRVQDEYRRKKRIAAGSFQNLWAFRQWVLPPRTQLGFAFFSHKVLRWFGGFLLLICWLSAGALAFQSLFFQVVWLFLTLLFLGIPALHFLCKKLKINILVLTNLHYFLAMNLALMAGFFKFKRGIRQGIWQRTPRV